MNLYQPVRSTDRDDISDKLFRAMRSVFWERQQNDSPVTVIGTEIRKFQKSTPIFSHFKKSKIPFQILSACENSEDL